MSKDKAKKLNQYAQDPELAKFEALLDSNAIAEKKFEATEIIKGDKGEEGKKGDKGDIGIQGKQGLQGKQGVQGKTGKDGKKGEQGEKGFTGFGFDGKDGVNGKDGIDGTELKNTEARDLIESLKGDERTEQSAIKDLTEDLDKIREDVKKSGGKVITGGARQFTRLQDTPENYVGQAGKVATVNADETGLEFADVGTDHITTANFNNTTNELTFTESDGNTQVVVIPDDKITLINDLTTGGTTQALTAEQGVVLKGMIDNISLTPGATGEQGIQGEQGIAGTNGTDGADGEQGIQGEAGADGINGVDGTNGVDGGGVTNDTDPQTNLSATAVVGDLAYDTTDNELQVFDGTNFVNPAESEAQASTTTAIASGSTLGLEQGLLAKAGQPGLTVLAVGNTTSGKVQGTSLGDGNVVEVYANGTDFSAGTVLYREFMSMGEPICFTGLANGAIINSSQGFYGFSEQTDGSGESPMPLLSYGLSFKSTFLYGFRNSDQNNGIIHVVNGPLQNVIKLTDGAGVTQLSQENIDLAPWEYRLLTMNGDKEYVLEGTSQMMACTTARMTESVGRFADSRLIMPLTNDGITWPRSGFVSAPYDNTQVEFFTRDNTEGFINSTAGTGVSPGSPVDFDAAIGVGTGASDTDYEPNGATRVLATGLISAYSGADTAGYEASPLMPTSGMSQVLAQPLTIDDSGDGGNSGVAIASPFKGTARVYSWNDTTKSLDLEYTVPLNRNGVTVTSKEDQKHPAAGLVANETSDGSIALVGDLKPGIVIADVPITVVVQNALPSLVPTIRSQNGTTTTGIINNDDETLSLGITPKLIQAEIREGSDGILYRRDIGSGGTDTWVEA